MPRGDGQPPGTRRSRGGHPPWVPTLVPKKLARRLNDETAGSINWSKVNGNTHMINGWAWHRPGSQNPRK